jgi:hypothetical protein
MIQQGMNDRLTCGANYCTEDDALILELARKPFYLFRSIRFRSPQPHESLCEVPHAWGPAYTAALIADHS